MIAGCITTRVGPPDQFDAYYKWLGIPAKDQPPTHYRLLSIECFESDSDVIEHAADRQMAHVRQFQIGAKSDVSQRILNEISVAKCCLLNVDSKARYDEQLRARQAAATARSAVVPAAQGVLPVATSIAVAKPPAAIPIASAAHWPAPNAFLSVVDRKPIARRRRHLARLIVPLAAVSVVIALLAFSVFVAGDGRENRGEDPAATTQKISSTSSDVRSAIPQAPVIDEDAEGTEEAPTDQADAVEPNRLTAPEADDRSETKDGEDATTDAPVEAETPLGQFAGAWRVTYASGAIRHYAIDKAGRVSAEHGRGQISQRDQDFVLDFKDGKLERIRRQDDHLLVEHFDPAANYPGQPTLQGTGVPFSAVLGETP